MLRLLNVVTLMLTFAISAANSQGNLYQSRFPGLEFLGERTVDFKVDHDTLEFRNPESYYANRWYSALHFAAEISNVRLIRVNLIHFNGFVTELPVDQIIRANQQTLRVPFERDLSYLRSVEMVYRTQPGSGERARVLVFAESSSASPQPSTWVTLQPCLNDITVFTNDETRLRIVGPQRDLYRAVRLRLPRTRPTGPGGVRIPNSDIELISFAVYYPDGRRDFKVLRRIYKPGDETEPLDLTGTVRRINLIEVRAKLPFIPVIPGQPAREGTVCAQALP